MFKGADSQPVTLNAIQEWLLLWHTVEIVMVHGCEVHSALVVGGRKQARKHFCFFLDIVICSKGKAVPPQRGNCCYSAVLKIPCPWFSEVGSVYFVAFRCPKFGVYPVGQEGLLFLYNAIHLHTHPRKCVCIAVTMVLNVICQTKSSTFDERWNR